MCHCLTIFGEEGKEKYEQEVTWGIYSIKTQNKAQDGKGGKQEERRKEKEKGESLQGKRSFSIKKSTALVFPPGLSC